MRRLVLLIAAAAGCTTTPTEVACAPACASGFHCAAGACVSDGSDDASTGGDGGAGGCMPACGGLTPLCNASHHCVECLDDSACPMGSYCKVNGDNASCAVGCATADHCGGGRACCGMACVDTGADPNHCGGCDTPCAVAHAQASCSGGKCARGACDAGWGDCDGNPANGCETNLHLDAANCGGCGMGCALAHAVDACSDVCYISACDFGWDDCNGDVNDGCETTVLSDPANCGGCGKSCAGLPHAQASCVAGNCVLGACSPGFGDCDGNPGNGCETDLTSDTNNCVTCGNACPMGQGCYMSKCVMAVGCVNNPKWTAVTCTTPSWVWSADSTQAKDVPTANAKRVLWSGCHHSPDQPQNATGMCSLDGKGWVSTQSFTMAGCNNSWWHLGGSYTGQCGGHDGDLVRRLAIGVNDCFDY